MRVNSYEAAGVLIKMSVYPKNSFDGTFLTFVLRLSIFFFFLLIVALKLCHKTNVF